jgi:glycosyltransferase domain-containing protein
MARLLIPTRNRPTSLLHVLRFLARFYPGTAVLIADGSTPEFKERNRRSVDGLKGELEIEYRQYADEIPLFDRLLDVVETSSDPFFVMGSDDDFPLMEVFERAEARLRSDDGFSTGMGALVHLRLFEDEVMNARIDVARTIAGSTVEQRMRAFSRWPYSTTYAISRRDLLLERYRRATKFSLPGFFDYAVGLLDCTMGKMLALPMIGFICTRNYNHSYLRAETPLIYLRRSEEVLGLRDRLAEDVRTYGGVEADEADDLATLLINRRVAALSGVPPHRIVGFAESPSFNNPLVQTQFQLFRELFEDGTRARKTYLDRLMYVSKVILDNAHSDDNKGEKKFYEMLT